MGEIPMSLSLAQKKEALKCGGLGLILLALPVVFWLIPSYFEARTYSRLTGASVSTWDALWVEFRVQEGVSPAEGPY
jgi:hypothetical protein